MRSDTLVALYHYVGLIHSINGSICSATFVREFQYTRDALYVVPHRPNENPFKETLLHKVRFILRQCEQNPLR